MVKANPLPVVHDDETLTIEYYEDNLLDVDEIYPPNLAKDVLHANMIVKISIGDESQYELEGYSTVKEDDFGGLTFVGKLVSAIESVRQNHAASIHEDICLECDNVWPCKTIQDMDLIFDYGHWQEGYFEPTSVTTKEIDRREHQAKIDKSLKKLEDHFGHKLLK